MSVIRHNLRRLATGLIVFASALPVCRAAHAVVIDGDLEQARIELSNESIQSAFDALAAHGVTLVRSSVPLTDTLSGTYFGTLPRVIAAVLDNYNYFLKTTDDRIEVVVMGRRGGLPIATPSVGMARALPALPQLPPLPAAANRMPAPVARRAEVPLPAIAERPVFKMADWPSNTISQIEKLGTATETWGRRAPEEASFRREGSFTADLNSLSMPPLQRF